MGARKTCSRQRKIIFGIYKNVGNTLEAEVPDSIAKRVGEDYILIP